MRELERLIGKLQRKAHDMEKIVSKMDKTDPKFE
jgi:hypothetical protein